MAAGGKQSKGPGLQHQSVSVHTGNQAAGLQEAPGWAGGVGSLRCRTSQKRFYSIGLFFHTLAPPCACSVLGLQCLICCPVEVRCFVLVTYSVKPLHLVSKYYRIYSTLMETLVVSRDSSLAHVRPHLLVAARCVCTEQRGGSAAAAVLFTPRFYSCGLMILLLHKMESCN